MHLSVASGDQSAAEEWREAALSSSAPRQQDPAITQYHFDNSASQRYPPAAQRGKRMTDEPSKPHNHWSGGDLIVEEKTMFRPVGWQGQSGAFYSLEADARRNETGSYSPVYVQIATWVEGEGWND